MADHTFRAETVIPLPRERVFEFFSQAENLELITPPELSFKILTPLPIEIAEGALIDYMIKLHGFNMRWQTEIINWQPPFKFTDIQLKGPYSKWHHTHIFTALSDDLTQMIDEVEYRLPFPPFGELAYFFVRREVEGIFEYRNKVITEMASDGRM